MSLREQALSRRMKAFLKGILGAGVSRHERLSSLARERPQQAAGGGEEVDGGRTICDEGRLQPESLKHLHLQREVESDWLQRGHLAHRKDNHRERCYLSLWPRPRHLLQRVTPQTVDQLTEALALDPSQTLLLLHLQAVHLLLVAQLLLTSLRQTL